MKSCFRVHPDDNVATLLEDAEAEPVNLIPAEARAVKLNQPVALGHKVALTGIPAGGPVIKYGIRIGTATRDIRPGDWVHLHNCASLVDERAATLEVETGRPTDTPYE
jgi:altronate dehydratase small subunit